jgi:hypothetical protein
VVWWLAPNFYSKERGFDCSMCTIFCARCADAGRGEGDAGDTYDLSDGLR